MRHIHLKIVVRTDIIYNLFMLLPYIYIFKLLITLQCVIPDVVTAWQMEHYQF
jgi:hypothetical protein